MTDTFQYDGPELEVFLRAENWQRYIAGQIAPFLNGRILEVGAGIGTVSSVILNGRYSNHAEQWLCLERDPALVEKIRRKIADKELPNWVRTETGTVRDLDKSTRFDGIMYVDVLEHIEDDAREIAEAASRLEMGGNLIVMAPAHAWLFSELDQAAGHFRRYTKSSLSALKPANLVGIVNRYLDCAGVLASLGNKLFLGKGVPNQRQIFVWDRILVPVSRILDPLLFFWVGKSVLVVWQKR